MDIQNVITFLSILKNGTFQGAAKEMGYVQSTVTNQIQKLESEMGAVLFERGKRIQLTQAGLLFQPYAEQFIADYNHIHELLSNYTDETKGIVRVGISEPYAGSLLPIILCRFNQLYPDIDTKLTIDTSPILNQLVLDGKIDFAITPCTINRPDISFQILMDLPIVAAISRKNPLSLKDKLSIRDLRNQRILMLKTKSGFYEQMVKLLKKNGAEPYELIDIVNMITPIPFVAQNYGIGFITSLMVTDPHPDIVVREIEGCSIRTVFGIYQKKNTALISPAARNLIRFIQEQTDKMVTTIGDI